jgi:hypothetical protein
MRITEYETEACMKAYDLNPTSFWSLLMKAELKNEQLRDERLSTEQKDSIIDDLIETLE